MVHFSNDAHRSVVVPAEAAAFARHALRDDGGILIEQSELEAPGEAVMVLALADELDHASRAAEQGRTIAGANLGRP